MARIVQFDEIGGPDVLKVRDIDVPAPAGDEVQIAVRAIGLNRPDSMFRQGIYFEQPDFPAGLGYEAAGTVAAIGSNVSGLEIGDVVSVIPSFSYNDYGMYGELVNAPAYAVVRHPAGQTFEEAAATWMPYLTAYGALIQFAAIGEGDTVVIPAASSSVGLAAIQIARMVGATPIAISRMSTKREALLDAGAAHVIASSEQDVVAEILRLTDGRGAKLFFDPVGGDQIVHLCRAAAPLGTIIIYGVLSGGRTPLPIMDMLGKGLTIRAYSMTEVYADPARRAKAIAFVADGLARGALKPVIARTFPLDRIVEAHRALDSSEHVGKLVLTT